MKRKETERELARMRWIQFVASAFPPFQSDEELVKELTAPQWSDRSNQGIMIELKDEVVLRLPHHGYSEPLVSDSK